MPKKGKKRRFIDSYRPVASSRYRSPTIAAESEEVLNHSNKRWQRAKSFNNSTPQGDASLAIKFSRGQSQDHSSPTSPIPNQNSPSTSRDPEQLTQLYPKGRKNIGMPDTAQSRRSSRTGDHNKRNESEAQSRGFYGSSRSPTSNITHLGRYELKRHRDDKATDRSPKRRREADEKRDENEDEASRNVFDPHSNSRQASQLQKPAHMEQGVSKTTPERTPIPGASPKGRTSTINTSEHLTTLRQAPGSLSTPPSIRPNISPRDPRRRRDSAMTPLVSPLQSLQMSPEFRDSSSALHQMLGEPPSNPSQRRPLGLGDILSQTSGRQQEHESSSSSQREAYAPPSSSKNNEDVSRDHGRKDEDHPSALSQNEEHPSRAPSQVHSYSSQAPARNEDHLEPVPAPNEHSADDNRVLYDTRMKAWEEENRATQKQHDEEQARKKLQERREIEHEVDEKINRLRHEADMTRKAAAQRRKEEHEKLLAELRQP